MEPSNLALFWAGVLGYAVLLYVILDGLDIGVGILFGATRDEAKRAGMMYRAVLGWQRDLAGGDRRRAVCGVPGCLRGVPQRLLFSGAVDAVGLILRGIAFEFRYRSERMRPIWHRGFSLGSVVVAFAQGAAVGAMIRGIPVANGQYAGGPFGWPHPFAILTGIGLVLGNALLGAGWLVLKNDGELRDWAHHRTR